MNKILVQSLKIWVILSLVLIHTAPKTVQAQANPQVAASYSLYLPMLSNTNTALGDPTLLAAGDIVRSGSSGAQQTADLVKQYTGTVLALGDTVYGDATSADYNTFYQPTWGAFKDRTKPVPGNHEYQTADAAGYFGYFGAAAGDPTKGYYSFDVGSWHILAINSNCSEVVGCGSNSPQETWVKADLAATQAKCVLAYWHHPLYSSGTTGSTPEMRTIWQDLYNANADIVLSGHEHNYERFLPQDANANKDLARGIVQFVVGTGGSGFAPLVFPLKPNSAANEVNVYGVLRLTLHPDSYTWQFISVDGLTQDTGRANCH